MSDADDRLAGLDPAAHQTYQHADLDAMITRIVAVPVGASSARWQRLQARFAGGLIAATLATALAFVATQGAPSLPALAIQRALTNPSPSFATAIPMKAAEDLHFRASAAISTRAPSIASYKIDPPASARAETARLAALFGVSGTPTAGGNGNWTVTSPSGAALNYSDVGVPQWYYSSTSPQVAPAEKSSSVPVPMPSHASLESTAQLFFSKLDYNYALSSPDFSTATTSTTTPAGAPLTVFSETASYSVVVDGTTTGQTISFTVNPQNALVSANGPAFNVGTAVHYPLESPRAGVAALAAAEKHTFAAAAKVPVATASVTSNIVSLAPFRLKTGALWLLPLYVYSGSIPGAEGPASRTWSELAVEPTYVTGSSATFQGVSN